MAREEVIQELRWIKEGTVLSQEARNALDIAIAALKSKYICEEIAFMCNLSGGADYFSAFEKLSSSLTKLNNTIEELNKQNEEPKNHVRGLTSCRAPEDKETIDDDTVCVVFCNWNVAKELVDKDKNIEDCLVISSYLDDNEAVVVSKDEFLKWVRGEQDG